MEPQAKVHYLAEHINQAKDYDSFYVLYGQETDDNPKNLLFSRRIHFPHETHVDVRLIVREDYHSPNTKRARQGYQSNYYEGDFAVYTFDGQQAQEWTPSAVSSTSKDRFGLAEQITIELKTSDNQQTSKLVFSRSSCAGTWELSDGRLGHIYEIPDPDQPSDTEHMLGRAAIGF